MSCTCGCNENCTCGCQESGSKVIDGKVYKAYRYYEGLCSGSDFVKELSRVLSVGVRTSPVKDANGAVIAEPTILPNKNWDIVYPKPKDLGFEVTDKLDPISYKAKIENQIGQISDTVILKTTTTPVELKNGDDDIAIDRSKLNKSLTMYLEIYKPTYIANPEDYPLDCERQGIVPRLITKEIYENAFKVTRRRQEIITDRERTSEGSSEKKVVLNTETLIKNASITFEGTESYKECSALVSSISASYTGDPMTEGFYMPSVAGSNTNNLVFTKTMLSQVKANNVSLYNLILNSFNYSDNDYRQITDLTFCVTCASNTEYYVTLEAKVVKNIYTVKEGFVYIVNEANIKAEKNETVLTTIVPEFYVDGLYIPLNEEYWGYDDTQDYPNLSIIFKKEFTKNASVDGHLVIRYDVAKEEDRYISERDYMLNNHYVLMRLFDDLNDEGDGPSITTYEDNGDIKIQRAHISEWSKLSWYKDFEELFKDDIDSDISTNDVYDGTLFAPLRTAGLSSESKIHYWINTNNDRFSLVVMGNAALDFTRDRHIISACYCGKIDSFDNSIDDVSGNFALFTSASTEPCKTTLEYEDEQATHGISFTKSEWEHDEDNTKRIKFNAFVKDELTVIRDLAPGVSIYYLELPEGMYFNQDISPKYAVVDASAEDISKAGSTDSFNMVSEYASVLNVSYNDDNNIATVMIRAEDVLTDENETRAVCFGYSYYKRNIVLTSGVKRDYYGNIEKVYKADSYGLNTSDGVTTVSMYHTMTKTYYQKHQLMFTTTEEYMSKVLYGKSLYTGEYYADRIKVTHGNDGPRGMLSDMIVIDSASLYPFDELVINKDFEKDPDDYEETYIYFPITAPFSPLSDGPNARYGFAIKEKEVEPKWSDDRVVASLAAQQLAVLADNIWDGVTNDITPPSVTENGCTVLWSEVNEKTIPSPWYEVNTNYKEYMPVDLCVLRKQHRGPDVDNILAPNSLLTTVLTDNTATTYKSGDEFTCTVHYDGSHTLAAGADSIFYAVYNKPEDVPDDVALDDVIRFTVVPENKKSTESDYVYKIKEYLYCGIIGASDIATAKDIVLKDATPDCIVVFYDVDTLTNPDKAVIKGYSTLALDKDTLKYPSNVSINISKGVGKVYEGVNKIVPYNDSVTIKFSPSSYYTLNKVIVGSTEYTYSPTDPNWDYDAVNKVYSLTINNIVEDSIANIVFDSMFS